MSVETPRMEDVVEDLAVWLASEFSTMVPSATVRAIVRVTHRDLQNQIVPEELGEMTHRLARHRIARAVRVE
ncbi:hypothetical protein ACIQUM_05290 [Amycolatopsis azurea]|uniref:hypothetical protein n=1 Tax=Amycolatopsis azurea TaxID=36819 RepID=UPI00382DA36C